LLLFIGSEFREEESQAGGEGGGEGGGLGEGGSEDEDKDEELKVGLGSRTTISLVDFVAANMLEVSGIGKCQHDVTLT
jgi:hypothetical protein